MNNSGQCDGYGAQIQRIFSIKALADSLNLEFVLSPLKLVERQITQELLSESDSKIELTRFNEFLALLFPDSVKDEFSTYGSHNANNLPCLFFTILRNYLPALIFKKKIKVGIENAYMFIKIDPDLYSDLEFDEKAIEQVASKTCLKVNVHLRFVNFAIGTERYLDPTYYYQNLNNILLRINVLGLPYSIQLHSDFDEVLPNSGSLGISQSTQKYLEEMGVTDWENKVDMETFKRANECKQQIKVKYQNVIEYQSKDPLSSLITMANSDFLILSKSSFAFLAGILNKKGIVISPLYWNVPLTSWNG